MNPLIYSLDLTGTFVFALSGGLAAARSRLDPFGFVADALGLGLFVVAGTQLALSAGTHGGIAVMMGVTTGIAGGIIRDVLCNEVPLVLQQEIYALAALAGSLAYVLLDAGDAHPLVSAAVAFGLCAGLRLAAIRWNLSLPAYGGGRMS